jgi:hypothetical protein
LPKEKVAQRQQFSTDFLNVKNLEGKTIVPGKLLGKGGFGEVFSAHLANSKNNEFVVKEAISPEGVKDMELEKYYSDALLDAPVRKLQQHNTEWGRVYFADDIYCLASVVPIILFGETGRDLRKSIGPLKSGMTNICD